MTDLQTQGGVATPVDTTTSLTGPAPQEAIHHAPTWRDRARSVIKHIVAMTGGTMSSRGTSAKSAGSHEGMVMMETFGPEERSMNASTVEISNVWRQRIGTIVGEAALAVVRGRRCTARVSIPGHFDLGRADRSEHGLRWQPLREI